MFKIVTEIGVLKGILDAITCINQDAKIMLSENGIQVTVADAANAAMVTLEARKEAFEHFQADPGVVALDLIQLSGMLAGKETATLETDPEKRLILGMGRMKYVLRLIDPSSLQDPPRMPQITPAAAVQLDASDLRDAVRAAEKILDRSADITIAQDDTNFVMEAITEANRWEMKFPLKECGIRHGESHSMIALDYLQHTARQMVGKVQIESGIDYPLIMRWGIGDHVKVQYMLAPRIKAD